MNLSNEILKVLRESTGQDMFIVSDKDINTVVPKIKSTNPKATIKVVDDKNDTISTGMGSITSKDGGVTEAEEVTGESYNIYAICSKSTGKSRGDEKWKSCVKSLKGKPGYKLGEEDVKLNNESVNPKMTKNELIETVLGKRNVIKNIKVKDIIKK